MKEQVIVGSFWRSERGQRRDTEASVLLMQQSACGDVVESYIVQMWQRYFGPLATIVGIDINPECLKHQEPGIHVRIGDQSDPKFLAEIIKEFGRPDIVLDDGSHQMEHIRKSFEFLYSKLSKNGIYFVEDLHTAYWKEYGGGATRSDTFINISKRFIDSLNADHSRGAMAPDLMTRHTFGISFYDSVIVFERGTIPLKCSPQIGRA